MAEKTYTIRKHKNRKYRDLERHCYISVAEIWQLFQEGRNVKVTSTGTATRPEHDVTDDTLIQGLYDVFQQNKRTFAKVKSFLRDQN
jgi:polyhydroxyalkanoate synthesis regulator protein